MEQALRFSDSVVVQVAGPALTGQPVSGAAALGRKFDDVIQDMGRVVGPVIRQVSAALTGQVESCEVELAFSFTAEGNVYLCKATGEASIKVTAKLKAGS